MNWTIEATNLICHRCAEALYLAVRVPHPGFVASDGYSVTWVRMVPLCPRCDVEDASAHALLAFFAVYPQIDESNVAEFGKLLKEWVVNLPPRQTVSAEALDAEIAAWRSGEFDDPSTA